MLYFYVNVKLSPFPDSHRRSPLPTLDRNRKPPQIITFAKLPTFSIAGRSFSAEREMLNHHRIRLPSDPKPALMNPSSQVSPPTSFSADRGVIYLASGGRSYLGELVTSLKSLRQHEPDLPVTVFSKFTVPRQLRAHHVPYESLEHPLKQKVQVLPLSPYRETLFLDTDTTILRPIQPIFDHLQAFQLGVANMFLADWSKQPTALLELTKPNDYNTGVLLYRRDAEVVGFLQAWAEAVLAQDPLDMWAGHNCDQDYFNLIVRQGALQRFGVNFGPLDNCIWNVRGIMEPELRKQQRWGQAAIFHHRTRAMKFRKAVYSLTDGPTFYELCRKAFNRATGNRFLKNSVPRE